MSEHTQSTGTPSPGDDDGFNSIPTLDRTAALSYWSSIPVTDDGMLGGYGQITKIDLDASSKFLSSLISKRKASSAGTRIARAADFGAGFGRVTAGLLMQHCDIIDVVEPVAAFTTSSPNLELVKSVGRLGEVYTTGLESFQPIHSYGLIWCQWCLGQLTDQHLLDLFERCIPVLEKDGYIVVKENVLQGEQDELDEVDNSITRTGRSWTNIFARARLRVVAEELQEGFPGELFPVRTWALQPF